MCFYSQPWFLTVITKVSQSKTVSLTHPTQACLCPSSNPSQPIGRIATLEVHPGKCTCSDFWIIRYKQGSFSRLPLQQHGTSARNENGRPGKGVKSGRILAKGAVWSLYDRSLNLNAVYIAMTVALADMAATNAQSHQHRAKCQRTQAKPPTPNHQNKQSLERQTGREQTEKCAKLTRSARASSGRLTTGAELTSQRAVTAE